MDHPRSLSAGSDISLTRRASASSQQPQPSSPQTAASQSEELVETLYSHPSVRIISFTSTQRSFDPSLPSDNGASPGSLPPSSRLERVLAVGAFRIYRAPGSVAFLSCGSALQPILPKSQCWCINEDNSRFVLQIRRPQYWRIEVPVDSPDDVYRAELLRDVFDKISLFERTACPFERDFTVQLPSDPETPVKKRAWTSEGKNLIYSPFQSDLSPPAHEPVAINRGERSSSISCEFSLLDAQPRVTRKVHGRQSLGGADQYFEQDTRNAQMHGSEGSPDGIRLARNNTFSQGMISKGSMATSMPSSSSISTEWLQRPSVSIPGSSVGDTEPSRLNHTKGRLATGEDDEVRSRGRHHLENIGSSVNERVPQIKDELDVINRRDQEPRNYSGDGIADGIVSRSAVTKSETRREDSVTYENGDVVSFTSDHSNNEDDPASFEGSGGVAPINLAQKRRTRMLAERSFASSLSPTTATSRSSNPNVQATARKALPPRPRQSLSRGRYPSAPTSSFSDVQSWHSSVTPPLSSQRSVSPHTRDSSMGPGAVESSKPAPQMNPSPEQVPPSSNVMDVVVDAPVVSDNRESAGIIPQNLQSTADEAPMEAIKASESVIVAPLLAAPEDKRLVRRQSHAGGLSISHRALSPFPPAANILSPPRRVPDSRPTGNDEIGHSIQSQSRRVPAVLIQKTLTLILGPPTHLVKLMIKVAAKIAAGEWRGLVLGFGEAGEKIPVEWDYYSDAEFSDSDGDDVALTNRMSSHSDSAPRTSVKRRARYAQNDDHEVD